MLFKVHTKSQEFHHHSFLDHWHILAAENIGSGTGHLSTCTIILYEKWESIRTKKVNHLHFILFTRIENKKNYSFYTREITSYSRVYIYVHLSIYRFLFYFLTFFSFSSINVSILETVLNSQYLAISEVMSNSTMLPPQYKSWNIQIYTYCSESDFLLCNLVWTYCIKNFDCIVCIL